MKKTNDGLTCAEYAGYAALYMIAAGFFSWLFYDSAYALFLFAPFFILFIKAVKKLKRRKRDEEMEEGFLSALNSVSTSLSAGVSAENAFVQAETDMGKLYGNSSVIVKELDSVNLRVAAGQRLPDALRDMAGRWDIEEMRDFSVVFFAAVRSGGNLPVIISSCTQIMEDRRAAEAEARILIRGRQYEQRVMCIIPPGILAYLRLSSGGFIGVLYHEPFGVAVMTICLFVYVLAIFLSERIGDIRS